MNRIAGDDALRDPFLIALGERVRTLRARRGMTRKRLASEAGVSERHLANLETGQGNASVILLRDLARALGAPLADLVAEAPAVKNADGRIALLGLRGAGKSTLGRMLADDLRIPFVDLDRVIERLAGCDAAEIHSLYGASAFRRYELRALEETLVARDRAVIAAGGGIVTEPVTFDLLLAQCFTVWLRATPDDHMRRVIAQGDLRPMAGNDEAMEDLKRILASREPAYARADLVFDTSREPLAATYLALRQALAGFMHYIA